MLMSFPVTSIYAVLFTIIYLLLSINVHQLRKDTMTVLGDKGNDELQRAVRAHGNFIEYVPLGLILMMLIESSNNTHGAGSVGLLLILGRIFHAYSVTVYEKRTNSYLIRITAMYTTFAALAFGAYLVFHAWMETSGYLAS